jgi:small subunit ribosomal protein S18
MARDKKKKSQAADRRRPIKKKTSILSSESIDWVDYKDVNLLRRFMSERAKIRARRVTGNSAQQQRAVARAIRIAREMALLPYSVRQVTQRSRGGRRDRGDRDRGDRDRGDRDRGDRDRDRMPEPPPGRDAAAPAAEDEGASAPAEGGNGAEAPPEVAAEAPAPAPAGGEDQS